MKNIKQFESFLDNNKQTVKIGQTVYKKPYTLKVIKIIRYNYIVGEILEIDHNSNNSRHLEIGDHSFFVINAELPF